MTMKHQPLHDRIALVAGATRGAGRAIAIELGRAGATVYVTGRSTRAEFSPMFMTAYYAAPFMIERKSGLIIEITDGVGYHYRGNLFYSLAKIGVSHLAQAMAADLKPHGVTSLAVTPGFLRSEAMLEHFGVREDNWRDAAEKDIHFLQSETPYFIARGIAALAADPQVAEKSGQLISSWGLFDEYGFIDTEGRRPHWGRYAEEHGF